VRAAVATAFVLALVVVAALFAVPALFDPAAMMRPIEERAAAAGLTLETDTEPRIRVLWRPALEIEGLRVVDRNGERIASAAAVEAELDLFDLIAGEPTFGTVRIAEGTLPLDAAFLSRLATVAPSGARAVTLDGGRFEAAGNAALSVVELRIEQDGGDTVVRGKLGESGTIAVEGALADEGDDGLRPARLALTQGEGPAVEISGLLGRADEGWLLDDIELALPDLRLGGDGVLRTEERWKLSLGLHADGGALDALPANGILAAIGTVSRIARLELMVRLDRAAWRGGTVENFQMDMTADRGGGEIIALVATLPGLSTVSLSGTAAEIGGPDAVLAGKGLADTGDPVALLDWLGLPMPWAAGAVPQHAVLDTGYRIDAHGFALEGLTARLGSTTAKGDLAWTAAGSALDASLSFNRLQMDELAAPGWLLPAAVRPFALDIHVAALRSGERELGPAQVRVRGDGERIAVDRLALPDLDGMALSLDGAVEDLRGATALDLAYRAEGPTLSLWSAFGLAAPRWMLEPDGFEMQGTLRGPFAGAAVEAEGRYGNLPLAANGTLSLGLDGTAYDLDVLAKRDVGLPIHLPLALEGDTDRVTVTIGDDGLVGNVPLAGRIEAGLGDRPASLAFSLRSEVGPILAALGSNAQATGNLEAYFDGIVAPVGKTGLAGALEGGGGMKLAGGTVGGFDLARLDRAVAEADGPTGLINLVAQAGGSGATRIDSADIPFTVSAGNLEIRNATADAQGADTITAGVVEMATGRVDLHTRMTLDSTPDAPPIALDIRGHLNRLRARLDFNALQQFLIEDD